MTARRPHALLVAALVMGAALAGCTSDPPVSDGAPPVAPAAPDQQIRYVALGGRETSGQGLSDGFRRSWSGQVFAALPRSTVFVNLASPDATTTSALQEQLPRALEIRPTVATVWFGGADRRVNATTDSAFTRDLTAIVTQLRAGGARVLLLTRPDARGPSSRALIQDVATTTRAELVELPEATDFRDPATQTAIAQVVTPRVNG